MSAPDRRVLLIGWDAADWQVIHPLVDAGLMPTLEGIINDGNDRQSRIALSDAFADPLDEHRDRKTLLYAWRDWFCRTAARSIRNETSRHAVTPLQSIMEHSFAVGPAQHRLRVAGKPSGRTDSRRDGLESFLRAATELHA